MRVCVCVCEEMAFSSVDFLKNVQPYFYSSLFLSRLQFEARKLAWKDIKAEKYSRRATARDFPSAAVPQAFQVQLNRCVWLCAKVIVFQLCIENNLNKVCTGRRGEKKGALLNKQLEWRGD